MRHLTPLAVVCAFALGACGDGIKSGVVVGKEYDDPDTVVVPILSHMCSGGNPPVCTTVVAGFVPIHDGPHWRLRLRNDEGKTGKVEVDPSSWGHVEIGQHWGGS